ncbi:MAG: iron-containing redox enzyme family protein [Gammaproteobacteria bacterium]
MKNNSPHPFDPSYRPHFSKAAHLAARPYLKDGRELFYTLMHISERYAAYPAVYLFIKRQLSDSSPHEPIPDSRFEDGIDTAPLPELPLQPESNDLDLRSGVLQWMPVALTEPDWLQSVSQAATSQNPLAIDLMAAYLELTKGDTPAKLFRALMLTAGIDPPPMVSRSFAQEEAIADCLFDFAATQVALGCLPRVFFPEILGFTLAYCRTPTILEIFRKSENHPVLTRYLDVIESRKNSTKTALSKVIDEYLQLFSGQAGELRRRIQSGFLLYRSHVEQSRRHLCRLLQHPPSTDERWAKLLRGKASFAVGHHRRVKLAGRTLDDWFAQSPFDSAGFASALKQSPYIDAEDPGNSPLLKLFDFNGPMFGVLDEEERSILESWLILEHSGISTPSDETDDSAVDDAFTEAPCDPMIDFSNLGNRELYYFLVNVELYPEALVAAKQKVHEVLRAARRFSRLPFSPYSHQAFESHIADLYRSELARYRPLGPRPKLSKEAYLWGIEQFAPAILIDGCWLQAAAQLKSRSNRTLVAFLLRIYADEIGNGRLKQNHPFIYQQLLNDIDLDLPSITSREFIEYPGFIDSAFDLPVYLLSISRYPIAFLPELLGLNMAIELSGLGNVYLRLSEEMKFWGIDPAIVDIHISIDNLSSGHAFLAKKTIQLYLDDIAAIHGVEAIQHHWRRIFDGYCSLHSVSRGFTFSLVYHYLLNRITKRRSRHSH